MGAMIDKAQAAIDKVNELGDLKGKIFTEFDPDRILAAAAKAEEMAAANPDLPLAGMLVSIKDLYDEAGIATTAASKLLLDRTIYRSGLRCCGPGQRSRCDPVRAHQPERICLFRCRA